MVYGVDAQIIDIDFVNLHIVVNYIAINRVIAFNLK